MNQREMSVVRLWVAMCVAIPIFGCAVRTTHKVETTHRIDAHIVIDIRQIEKDMEEIEGVVEQGRSNKGEKTSLTNRTSQFNVQKRNIFVSIFSFAIAEAAEAVDLTDEMNQAVQSRKERLPQLEEYKAQGSIGENNQGMVELREMARTKAEPGYKKKVVALVKAENRDREIIYKEYVKATGLPAEALVKVKASAAKTRREKAKKGEWIQLPDDPEGFAQFKASKFGKLLGKGIEPGKWCRMP